jgi:hypothetical protein
MLRVGRIIALSARSFMQRAPCTLTGSALTMEPLIPQPAVAQLSDAFWSHSDLPDAMSGLRPALGNWGITFSAQNTETSL